MTEILNNVVFSATALKDFMSCPRKFQLRKEKVVEDTIGSQLLLGTAVHSTVQAYYEKAFLSDGQAANYFEQEYKKQYGEFRKRGLTISYSKYNNYKKDIREGSAMCQGFVQHVAPLIQVLGCEVSLNAHIHTDAGIFPLECHIDLVLDEPGGYVVSDIKTGKSQPHAMYMMQDVQLEMYAFALQHGVFIDVDRTADSKTYTQIDEPFKRVKPVIGKSILNLRGLINDKGEVLPAPDMGNVMFRSDVMSQTHFDKTVNAYVKSMNFYEQSGYWPKHIGSIHDSSCNWCAYYSTCSQQD